MRIFILFVITASLTSTQAARKTNCGLKCFGWARCMGQLAGNENRPHQLGDTGQIVLTKCDQGSCDCNQVLQEEKSTRNTQRKVNSAANKKKPSVQTPTRTFSPSIRRPTDAFRSSLRTPIRMPLRKPTTTTTTTTEKPKIRKPGKPAVVIGTSVSSSVSVSSSSGKAKEEDTPQALEKMTFAERFKRHRLRLFQERKRFY